MSDAVQDAVRDAVRDSDRRAKQGTAVRTAVRGAERSPHHLEELRGSDEGAGLVAGEDLHGSFEHLLDLSVGQTLDLDEGLPRHGQ